MNNYWKDFKDTVKRVYTFPFDSFFWEDLIQPVKDVGSALLLLILWIVSLVTFPVSAFIWTYFCRKDNKLQREKREALERRANSPKN